MSGLVTGAAALASPVGAAWAAIPASIKKWGLIALAVIAVLLIGKCAYDRHERQMLSDHDNAMRAQAASDEINAINSADQADRNIANADAAQQANVQGAITNAVANHPQDAGRSDGPATAAALRCLRTHAC